jgi:hypothetical protein
MIQREKQHPSYSKLLTSDSFSIPGLLIYKIMLYYLQLRSSSPKVTFHQRLSKYDSVLVLYLSSSK